MPSLGALPPGKGSASHTSTSSGKHARSALKSAQRKPVTAGSRIAELLVDSTVSNAELGAHLEQEPLKKTVRNDAFSDDGSFELKPLFRALGSRITKVTIGASIDRLKFPRGFDKFCASRLFVPLDHRDVGPLSSFSCHYILNI